MMDKLKSWEEQSIQFYDECACRLLELKDVNAFCKLKNLSAGTAKELYEIDDMYTKLTMSNYSNIEIENLQEYLVEKYEHKLSILYNNF